MISTFLAVLKTAIYSVSVVDSETSVYFTECQYTEPPAIIIRNLKIDLQFSISLVQSASE